MAIIDAWTSIADFDGVGTKTAITSAAQIAPYAREGAWPYSASGFLRSTFTPQSSLWLQFHYFSDAFGITTSTNELLKIRDVENGQVLFAISDNGPSGSLLKIRYWNGSAFVDVVVSSRVHSANVRYKFDVQLVISDTVGIFNVYLDNVLVLSYTGDTKWTSATTVSCIDFCNVYNSGWWSNFSGVILADEDTRSMVFDQEQASANGANTAWTGVYTDVTKLTQTDTTLIESGTANQVETYTMGDLNAGLASYAVKAVVLAIRARKGTSGPQNLQGVVRQAGVDYFTATLAAPPPAFGPRNAVMNTNPATGAAWTQAEVNAAELGVKSIA